MTIDREDRIEEIRLIEEAVKSDIFQTALNDKCNSYIRLLCANGENDDVNRGFIKALKWIAGLPKELRENEDKKK